MYDHHSETMRTNFSIYNSTPKYLNPINHFISQMREGLSHRDARNHASTMK